MKNKHWRILILIMSLMATIYFFLMAIRLNLSSKGIYDSTQYILQIKEQQEIYVKLFYVMLTMAVANVVVMILKKNSAI